MSGKEPSKEEFIANMQQYKVFLSFYLTFLSLFFF